MEKVLFVDNHIFSFAANLKNGIPVVDFLGDRQDTELLKVANYVLALADESNLMRANEQVFGLQRIKKAQIDKFIKYYGVDEMTEYDDTDFDDNGGTVVSQAPLDYYIDSLEENIDDCQWQLNESISKK